MSDVEDFSAIFKELVSKGNWIFAKTYANTAPHEYVLRKMYDRAEFDKMIKIIRHCGFMARYDNCEPTIYFIDGEHYYWTMGAPVKKTIVINRALLSDVTLEGNQWVRKLQVEDEDIH